MIRRGNDRRGSLRLRRMACIVLLAAASLAVGCSENKPPPKINASEVHKPLLKADAKTCMICHVDPVKAKQLGNAPVMKHPPRPNCISCHVAPR